MSSLYIDPSLVLAFGLELESESKHEDSGINRLRMPKRPELVEEVASGLNESSREAGSVDMQDLGALSREDKVVSVASNQRGGADLDVSHFVAPSPDMTRALGELLPGQHAVLDRRFGLSSGQSQPSPLIASDLEIPAAELDAVEASGLRALFTPKK